MKPPPLSACITRSLKLGETDTRLVEALFGPGLTKARHHCENQHWEYKEQFNWRNPIEVARMAKHVLAFHNAGGGLIVIGISNAYVAVGVPASDILDSNQLRDKLERYLGDTIPVFQDQIALPNGRRAWLLFVEGRGPQPRPVASNGPEVRGSCEIVKGAYYVRVRDESRTCVSATDFQRHFGLVSRAHETAYLFDVSEPYFRLLRPHCEHFVGRTEAVQLVREKLRTHRQIIQLEGLGGVGKSEIAIHVARQLYDSKDYQFIISLSAKSRVWTDHVASRTPGFSGFEEFLKQIATVLGLETHGDLDGIQAQVVELMTGTPGLLLVDNLEDVDNDAILTFLAERVPPPVKVLVTSRVDRNLGGLPVPIPAMEPQEATELLQFELESVGYRGPADHHDLEELLEATGRIPLAIKWAASLAESYGSLQTAASRLRRSDSKKREFWSFCLSTMYNDLPPLAQKIALLAPYVGDDWSVPTVALALDEAEEEVRDALERLRRRGIVLADTGDGEGPPRMLPVTEDYMVSKLNEQRALKNEYDQGLATAIASLKTGFHSWPRERRAAILCAEAARARSAGNLERAEKLVRAAIDFAASDPVLRFLEGRIQYERGALRNGLDRMWRAFCQKAPENWDADTCIVMAGALFESGTASQAQMALATFEAGAKGDDIPSSVIENYFRTVLAQEQTRPLRTVLRGLAHRPRHAAIALGALRDQLSREHFIHETGDDLASALEAATKWDGAPQELRVVLQVALGRVKAMLPVDE